MMTEHELIEEAKELTTFQRHKFMVMVGGTIAISLVLVAWALYLYASSGTEQLDLSRPGYQKVSEQITRDSDVTSFPSTGAINDEDIAAFLKQYDEHTKKLISTDSFGGDAMSDEALQLGDPIR